MKIMNVINRVGRIFLNSNELSFIEEYIENKT